ncbi:MAG TPA: TetR/AcrR family transcriptional regulator [Polyangiales bacterium]|nr:TetR/AcrR family transcriptional regulator [Polyangiales bacterium]
MPAKRARSPERANTSPGGEASELRERILHASIELIEEEGLAKLSMREVARRAGVTHQAPYHHFADREQILGEIAEEGFRMLSERIAKAAPAGEMRPDNVVQRICALGEAYVSLACDHPAHFRIMFRPELVDIDNCPGARDAGQSSYGAFQNIVHAAVEAGLPAVPSEAALMAFLWSVGHGLSCLILDGPLAEKMPDTAREQQIRSVVQVLQALLESSLSQARAATPARPAPRATTSGAQRGVRTPAADGGKTKPHKPTKRA